jgi:HSP20 family molecular chaperone IbpA
MSKTKESKTATCTPDGCRPAAENPAANTQYRRPEYHARTSESGYTLRVLLPGVNRKGVDVSADDQVLTVVANRAGTSADGWKAIHQEIPGYDYRLQVNLGAEIDTGNVSAKLSDGVLEIQLPKVPAVQPRRIVVK